MMVKQNLIDLDAIILSVSGGGMASGVAIAAKHLNPDIKSKCTYLNLFVSKQNFYNNVY